VRKQDGKQTKTLDECISTGYFGNCVKAVNELAEFDENTATYAKPTLALKLGQALGKAPKIVKRKATEARNDDCIHEAELFGDLCSSEWSEIIACRAKIMPVLFLPWHLKSIDTLLTYRIQAGILSSNCYVFAYSHSDHHLHGCDALRTAALKCGAVAPASLRSTDLCKHVATLCQVLNLKDHELDMLAGYMGHDVHVHRQYYRLPNDVLQTSKLVKVFLLMDRGNLVQQKGRSLDEIVQLVNGDEASVGES